MKKGVAIPYIIALILGVIVIVLLAYWLINNATKGSGVGKGAECRGRILDWCVTQSTDSAAQAIAACKNDATWNDIAQRAAFCRSVIPGWK